MWGVVWFWIRTIWVWKKNVPRDFLGAPGFALDTGSTAPWFWNGDSFRHSDRYEWRPWNDSPQGNTIGGHPSPKAKLKSIWMLRSWRSLGDHLLRLRSSVYVHHHAPIHFIGLINMSFSLHQEIHISKYDQQCNPLFLNLVLQLLLFTLWKTCNQS